MLGHAQPPVRVRGHREGARSTTTGAIPSSLLVPRFLLAPCRLPPGGAGLLPTAAGMAALGGPGGALWPQSRCVCHPWSFPTAAARPTSGEADINALKRHPPPPFHRSFPTPRSWMEALGRKHGPGGSRAPSPCQAPRHLSPATLRRTLPPPLLPDPHRRRACPFGVHAGGALGPCPEGLHGRSGLPWCRGRGWERRGVLLSPKHGAQHPPARGPPRPFCLHLLHLLSFHLLALLPFFSAWVHPARVHPRALPGASLRAPAPRPLPFGAAFHSPGPADGPRFDWQVGGALDQSFPATSTIRGTPTTSNRPSAVVCKLGGAPVLF